MKNQLILLGAAALMLSACDLLSNPDTPHVVRLADPPHKAEAVKYVISEEKPIKTIELTESGEYIVEQTESFDTPGTPEDEVITGTYGVDPTAFKLEGFGEMKVAPHTRADADDEFDITITIKSGKVYKLLARRYKSRFSGDFADNLCRTWKPKETLLQVMGGEVPTDLGVGCLYKDGCNIPVIVEDLKERGISITEDLSAYKVKTLTLTKNGTIKIEFEGAKPYYGEWNPDLQTGNFTYEFQASKGNSIINGSGSGNVSFNKNDELVFLIQGVINADKKYAAKTTITFVAL